MSHVGEMYAKVLEQRTRYIVEPSLIQAQVGFRRGRGCTVTIFSLCQLSKNAIYEYDGVLNIAFMDQEKAFSRVNQRELGSVFEGHQE